MRQALFLFFLLSSVPSGVLLDYTLYLYLYFSLMNPITIARVPLLFLSFFLSSSLSSFNK
ncbi:hypothetical protein J3Q64DRAFT_1720658 [Phycomyces blakesleeanus]|uniref:Uncharacterized protein n=1 Tax=Phycomyces blakesleeanus TaxID=4837 RepID=A0ABR3B9J4_PHYBL